MPDLKEIVLAELAQGTHTEAFADGARWAVQEAEKLAAHPVEPVPAHESGCGTLQDPPSGCDCRLAEPAGVSDEAVGLYPLDNELVREFNRHAWPEGSVSDALSMALEAAQPFMQPQVVASPTIDQIAYALFEHDSETNGRATPWGELGSIMKATYLDRGEAVFALLSGSGS